MRNPVFESSMKRRMRSYRSPLLLTLYIAFLLVVSAQALITLQQSSVTLGNLRSGLEAYVYLSVMQFALIILVAPALTAAAISGERERQTLDLLLCTRVGSLRIVLGKMLSSACFLALLIVSSLPVMAIILFYGGITVGEILLMQLFLLVTAVACCSIGIFCSALFKRTVTATVVAYLAIFAIGIGTLVIPLLFQREGLMGILGSITSSSFYAGGVTIMSSSGSASPIAAESTAIPFLLLVNPGVGFFSMLIEQTGLLRSTFENTLGYRGNQLFQLMQSLGSVALANIGVMAAVSVILTLLSALFVKPSGRKARKQK